MKRASAKNSCWRGHVFWFVLAGVALCCPLGGKTRACDEGKKTAKKDVKVSVLAILASEKHNHIDPRLDCIAREVRKVHPKLTGFRMAKMSCKSIPAPGGSDSFDLVLDQKALVTVLKTVDENNRVQLKITPPLVGDITYTTTCGKFFPIVTRYWTNDKERLIIAVRVQPCNKKK